MEEKYRDIRVIELGDIELTEVDCTTLDKLRGGAVICKVKMSFFSFTQKAIQTMSKLIWNCLFLLQRLTFPEN